MKYLASVFAGSLSVVLLAVFANVAFVVVTSVLWRNVPDVAQGNITIAWTPAVWELFRRSPLFWIASAAAFALTFRSVHGWLASRSSLVGSPDHPPTS